MANYTEQEKRAYFKEKKSKFRQEVVELFLQSLSKPPEEWAQGWLAPTAALPFNLMTGNRYRGVNRLKLMLVTQKNHWSDPRWLTFHQITKKEYHLRKGSKSVEIEFFLPYDTEQKVWLDWELYEQLPAEQKKNCTFYAKYSRVFNASQVEGVPPYLPEAIEEQEISPDRLLQTLSDAMGVRIFHDGGDQAFYRPSTDTIHLPEQRYFHSDDDYNGTVLHELTHASGAEHRLNRNIRNGFGTDAYAYEELVAEIGSTFMSEYLHMKPSAFHIKNHVAYVRNWIDTLQAKPEILFDAVKEADTAATYMEKMVTATTDDDLPF